MKYLLGLFFLAMPLFGQDYFTERYQPFQENIPAPKDFLDYEIRSQHTRHDQIVSYLEHLAKVSNQAQIIYYGKTHEGRKLPLLVISTPENLANLKVFKRRIWTMQKACY